MGEQDTVHCPESRIFSRNTQFFHLAAIEWNIIDTRPFGSDEYIPGHIFADSINGVGD